MISPHRILIFLSLLPFACFSHQETPSDPVIIRLPEMGGAHLENWALRELQLECTSWRVAVEANNLSPWKTIPEECGEYVREYMNGKGYEIDLKRVSNEAAIYARSVNLSGDGKDAWVFDVDETLISNLPYYVHHGYGLEIFDSTKFDEWVESGVAPVIEPSLKLYEEVLSLGFKVILLTGRSERHQALLSKIYRELDFVNGKSSSSGPRRIMQRLQQSTSRRRGMSSSKLVIEYLETRRPMERFTGFVYFERSFKLSNPMYYIP